jgi:glucose uptake protein GlcU
MKRILSVLVLSSILASPVIALAQEPSPVGYEQVLENIRYAMWIIFGLFAVIMFIIAGFYFLTAGGDPDRVAKSRSMVIYGVIGIIVAILGYSIVSILMAVVGA